MNKKFFKIFISILCIISLFVVFSFILKKSKFGYLFTNIKEIKTLLPLAINKVAQNPQCYKVLNADVSLEYSTKDSLIFYVDCSTSQNVFNIERFFVTEDELILNK